MPLHLHGLEDAIAEHQRLSERARDLTPFLAELATELEAMIRDAWASERSPGGDAWPPRKQESEATGALERAATVHVDGNSIVIDVALPHASYQFRTRNPLPVELRGGRWEWMERGPAGAWLERMPERLAAYLTGADA